MRSLWAIDPGPSESAFVKYDPATGLMKGWGKIPNEAMLGVLETQHGIRQTDVLAIEMIASYGMPVGKDVFETCVWIGRFIDRWVSGTVHEDPIRIPRIDVKNHLCHSSRATDANVRQALIDRFGPGKELAIGRKANPGPLYGLSGDGWAALGVAVTVADTRQLWTPQGV